MHTHQRYAVYHANDLFAIPIVQASHWYEDRSRYYTHVADVVAPLEQVFALTNHIDHSWKSNLEVVWHATAAPLRSTSVGDVIVSRESGQAWLVMPIGLQELPLDNRTHASNAGTPGASHMTPHDPRFPFGLSHVANYEAVCRHYAAAIPALAKEAPLPPALPGRHTALAQLEGRYAVQDCIPPWWHGCVDALTQVCPCLEPLLRTISREEFRRGSIDQQRWKLWRNEQCRLADDKRKPVPCWQQHGPGLYKIMTEVLPAQERPVWLERFVSRGDKDIPLELDLVITSAPEWWLNMGNGRGWYSCMGTGADCDPRIIGNWYDTGAVLAALVARGADCWTPDCLIARTTVRVVMDKVPTSEEQETTAVAPSALQMVLGRVYHNDLASACNLLVTLAALLEQQGMRWGCIAGTNTAQFAQDGSLGALDIERVSHTAQGVPYWLPATVERPALEGQVAYLERAGQESGGSWTYPSFSVYACHMRTPTPTPHPYNRD